MRIIARGKESIGEAVNTAEAALMLGVKKVVIECVSASPIAVVSLGTLAFCPVVECKECQAMPCPFNHKSEKVAELQAEYAEAEARLNEIARKLREAVTHG